jgi:hypothetical protein
MALTLKRGDTRPLVDITLTDGDAPVDLTAATSVQFHMALEPNTLKVDAPMTVVDAAAGHVRYAWAAADTDTAGSYSVEAEVAWNDGTVQTFPPSGYLTVTITEDLD